MTNYEVNTTQVVERWLDLACDAPNRKREPTHITLSYQRWVRSQCPRESTRGWLKKSCNTRSRFWSTQVALILWQDYWRPAYIVEQDCDRNSCYFFPTYRKPTRACCARQVRTDRRCVIHYSQSTRRVLKEDGTGIVQRAPRFSSSGSESMASTPRICAPVRIRTSHVGLGSRRVFCLG